MLAEEGIEKVLIVTDKVIHTMGIADRLKSELSAQGIGYAVYDGTVPNPTVKNVEEAREMYIGEDCQALIGFGGGSAIDCAKAVLMPIVLEDYGSRFIRSFTDWRLSREFPIGVIAPKKERVNISKR